MKTPIPFPTAPPAGVPLLVRYTEAAQMLGGVSRRHVVDLVARKKLKAVGRGKARRVLYSSILAYIDREAA